MPVVAFTTATPWAKVEVAKMHNKMLNSNVFFMVRPGFMV
jgi:hypothetical protein